MKEPAKGLPRLSATAWPVMRVLWDHGPMALGDIYERLPEGNEFHPFVWLANLRLRAERELIVDDEVLLHLNGARQVYGESLLRVLQQATPPQCGRCGRCAGNYRIRLGPAGFWFSIEGGARAMKEIVVGSDAEMTVDLEGNQVRLPSAGFAATGAVGQAEVVSGGCQPA